MPLRGVAPQAIEKRLKLLLYGPSGIGKTTAAIQFPRPYLIDTEKGAENEQYVDKMIKAGAKYFPTTDPDELIQEVTTLLSERHEFKTLVIDPLTVIYNDLLDKGAAKLGTDFGRHKQPANRTTKHLLNLLLRLDMNVIITSHAKPNWVRTKDAKGQDTVVQDGITFDCYDKLDYLFDLVIEVERRGQQRVGRVRKTRIEAFAEGDTFPFSYDEIAKRYGVKILEKDAVPQELASLDQVAELERLIKALHIPADTTEKWLTKAGAESWSEMPAESIEKCIAWAKQRISSAA